MTPQQGTAVAGASWFVAFCTQAIPVLHAASLFAGIVVAVLTAIYTVKRIKAKKFD